MRPLVLLPLAVLSAPAFAQEAAAPAAEDNAPSPAGGSPDGTPDGSADVSPDVSDETLRDTETGQEIRATNGEILVIAERIKGQVEAPQKPLMVLDEADIQAYGAANLTDLLDLLSPQTGSGRGRGSGAPVVLLNGRRISGFREIRDLPPEAIRRMEILPEEVALRFGYPPNQRVVNFILKDHFASKTLAGEYEPATRGGTADSEIEAGLLKIDEQRRLQITGKINDTTMLTEAERGVIQTASNKPTVASDPDPAQYRSLVDDSRSYALNGTWSTGLGKGAQAAALTINGAVTRSDTLSLQGLDTVTLVGPTGATAQRSLSDPLQRKSQATTFEGGLVLNKPFGIGWNFTATADGSYSDTRTSVEQPRDLTTLEEAAATGALAINGPLPAVAPGRTDRARSQTYGLNSLATLSGRPFSLPAGDAMLTVKGGFSYDRVDNLDTARDTSLDRRDLSTGVNLALPLTSRKNGVLGRIGDVSLNVSAGLNHLSDFGTIYNWSAGFTWAPTEKLNFQASYIVAQAAPSLANLGNPTVLSFNVPVFDFTRGESTLVTVINGGNPNLKQETQRDLKFGANWTLPFLKNASLLVEYFRNRSNDVTQSFPLLTPEIEAAFPGRVTREYIGPNEVGPIVSIDRSPVTFDQIKSSRIRWGFNIGGTIGKPQPGSGRGQNMMMGGPGGPGGPRPPGGFGGGGGGARAGGGPRFGGGGPGGPGGPGANGQGRWNLSIAHTIELTNTVLVAPGGPSLDLLGGDALTAGGVPRHSVELEGGGFYRGFGMRINGTWSAPVTVRGTSELHFGSVFKLNLRAFVNFDQRKKLVQDVPFLKGARLMFKVENLLDQRQRVTDANGIVPLNYQAAYRDPRGRVVGIDFRKMF